MIVVLHCHILLASST